MRVIHHSHCPAPRAGTDLPTPVAGAEHGLHAFEVATQSLAPGASSGLTRHGGELVALALAGCGKLVVDGGPQRFQAPCTLLLPAGAEFLVVNNGVTALQLVWIAAPPGRHPSLP